MKLSNLKIEGSKSPAWDSDKLTFGSRVTQLFGPNGCGKTPLIQSIVFALGYPIRFRDDIRENCERVILDIDVGGKTLTFERSFNKSFDLTVRSDGDVVDTFYDEKEFSNYILPVIGLKNPKLTSKSNEAVQPYISSILPLIYVDQDAGYTSLYSPPASFLKDQFSEMLRLTLGLTPKHSFERKKYLLEKTRRLGSLDRDIVSKESLVVTLQDGLEGPRRDAEGVSKEIDGLKTELASLNESRNLKGDAESVLDSLIYEKQLSLREIEREKTDLMVRIEGVSSIRNEIETEIDTLALNEEARRLFTSFDDICARSDCQLFLGSSESYGKNLLYLRDQIKDLDRNVARYEVRVDELQKQSIGAQEEVARLRAKQDEVEKGEEIDALIRSSSEITKQIVNLQRELQMLEELETEEKAYVSLRSERDSLQNEIASLGSTTSGTDLDVLGVRRSIADGLAHWMDVLNTRNVSRDIRVDSDFGITFGSEVLNQFAGSTLSRVVLAFHATLFELLASSQQSKFGFLILDTPRQQDLEAADLGRFLVELRKMIDRHDAQVVFSTTEYHYDAQEGDVEWQPSFEGAEQNMFLRSPVNQ